MSKKWAAALAALALPCASQAIAATPIVSGSYIVTTRHHCQEVLTLHFNSGGTVDSAGLGNGSNGNSQLLLTANFNAKKGKVTFNGFADDGSTFMLQLTGSQQGLQGEPLAEQTNNGSGTYSNTGTTLTLGGNVYNAMYGQIDTNGIPHVFSFMRFYTDTGNALCSEQGEATLQ